ncbi:hypothetical protein [Streptomyces sp. NPDC051993]|uniref:hypothetical protein n=1 Tax=Streptomyces sp. NPDC051993 TaxID=3155286 RepID=UPI00343C5EF1
MLGQYEQSLRQPGLWLCVPLAGCPCHDVLGAQNNLQVMLDALPSAARRELRQIVTRLDAEFERRTLPDPYASERLCSEWFASPSRPWWYLRLTKP